MEKWAQAQLCIRLLNCLNNGFALAGRRWPIGCQLWLKQTQCVLRSSLLGRTTWSAPCERWALAAKLLHSTAYIPFMPLGFRSCHLVSVQQQVAVGASACLGLHTACPAVACMAHQLLLDCCILVSEAGMQGSAKHHETLLPHPSELWHINTSASRLAAAVYVGCGCLETTGRTAFQPGCFDLDLADTAFPGSVTQASHAPAVVRLKLNPCRLLAW